MPHPAPLPAPGRPPGAPVSAAATSGLPTAADKPILLSLPSHEPSQPEPVSLTLPSSQPYLPEPGVLKVGIVAPPWVEVPPVAYGGVELVIDALARGLSALGHQVKLFTIGSSTCTVERLSLFDGPAPVIGDGLTGLRHAAAAYDTLADCDIIHDHSIAGVFLATYGHDQLQVPVVSTNHGPADDPHLGDLYRRTQQRVPVIAISHNQASRTPPEAAPAQVIHHGLDLARYRHRLRGDGHGPLVAIGRMHPDKGLDLAIEIARRAGRELLIAAKMREPAERLYFTEVIRPRLGHGVEFVGEVDHARKNELLTSAAALVNPIRWHEPFGLVMIEALACGTPVLATPNGAAPEIIRHGTTGYLASNGHDEPTIINELAAAVRHLAEIDRHQCRRDVVHRFSAEAMAQAHAQLYHQLIHRYRHSHREGAQNPTVGP